MLLIKNKKPNMEYTLSILKPDATRRNITGNINSYIEKAGLKIVAQRMMKLSREDAEKFYEVHKSRSFFNELVYFMISGPVIVQVLKGDKAVEKYRDIMGATNPANADVGTIRKDFAESIEANSVHGSDSLENAKTEIAFFFTGREIVE
jgi:nucleoside-diphosphate kinase